jgi:hypothetical protein
MNEHIKKDKKTNLVIGSLVFSYAERINLEIIRLVGQGREQFPAQVRVRAPVH